MVEYFDRNGAEISEERWRELSRDPGYCSVLTTGFKGVTIETSYVGLLSPLEKKRGIFCTQVRTTEALRKELVPAVWSESESEALLNHDELCKQYLFA